jgi:hypothetical protein
MKRTLMAALCIWVPLFCHAQELKLTVTAQPAHAVFGEPLRVAVSIGGQGSFVLPWVFGRCDQGHTRWSVVDEAGNRVPMSSDGFLLCPQGKRTPYDSKAMHKYDSPVAADWSIYLLPGRYRVQAEYHSHGPYLDRYSDTDQRPVTGIWEGDLTSNVAVVEIVAPRDEDLRALKQFGLATIDKDTLNSVASVLHGHQSDLLAQFPNSTYAAYAIWEHTDAKGVAGSNPASVVKAIETGLILRSEMPFLCPGTAGKLSFCRCNGREAIACRSYWYAVILKNHPDIWFADDLRLRSAIDQCTLQNYQAAQADLEAMAKSESVPMAGKAKEYLTLMKQKGWVKQ